MNGPTHYRCAQLRISEAHRAGADLDYAAYLMAEAQVHATLALAAATIHGSGAPYGVTIRDNGSGASSDQWREATR